MSAALKDSILPFPLDGENGAFTMTSEIERIISLAEQKVSKGKLGEEIRPSVEAEAEALLAAGDYEKVIGLFESARMRRSQALTDLAAWAWTMRGNKLADQGTTKSGAEAERLLEQAKAKREIAEKIETSTN